MLSLVFCEPVAPGACLPGHEALAAHGSFDTVDGTGIGLTPTVSWSPPQTGTADAYVVGVSELYASPRNTTGTRLPAGLSSFTTPHTSMTVPSGVLEAGRTYVFRITAVGHVPGVQGLNQATAIITSGLFTP